MALHPVTRATISSSVGVSTSTSLSVYTLPNFCRLPPCLPPSQSPAVGLHCEIRAISISSCILSCNSLARLAFFQQAAQRHCTQRNRPSRLRSVLGLARRHGLHWSLSRFTHPVATPSAAPAQSPSPTPRPRPREPAPSLGTRRLGHFAARCTPRP